jgi:hypothetical protein
MKNFQKSYYYNKTATPFILYAILQTSPNNSKKNPRPDMRNNGVVSLTS